MKRIPTIVLTLIVGFLPKLVLADDSLHSTLDQANQNFASAILAKNIDHLVGDYTHDACILAPSTPRTCGLEAIRKFWSAVVDSNPKDVKIGTMNVGSTGDLAYATGTLVITDASDNVSSNNYVLVLKDVDGVWKLHLDTWTPN